MTDEPAAGRVRRIAGTVLAAVLAISLTAVVTRDRPPAPARAVTMKAADRKADPLAETLRAHAGALLRGDQAGWLRAVDPRLHPRYRGVFRALRALRISAFDYHVEPSKAGRTTVDVTISYCFAGDPCPAYPESATIAQALTLRPAGAAFVITAVGRGRNPTPPVPWEAGDLVVREGRRVTVAAPRELAGRLPEVTRIADRAAAVDDRYAVLIGNPRPRYRLFLATPRAWRTWFGAEPEDWVAGYLKPPGDAVIDMAAVHDDAQLRHVIQHELGHVATIAGARAREGWLSEGLAEHIARATPDPADLRRSPTIAVRLPRGATAEQARAFYAGGHFAVRCLTALYGERAMVEFARLRLRAGETLTDAAQAAFGRSFATVDKACAGWISNRLVTSQE